MPQVITANDVVLRLMELGRELDAAIDTLKDAELDAVTKRNAADLAESHAFVNADGAMDMRKHLARIEAADAELAAVIAEAVLRHLRARIKAIEIRVDLGRSLNAALRAELGTFDAGQT